MKRTQKREKENKRGNVKTMSQHGNKLPVVVHHVNLSSFHSTVLWSITSQPRYSLQFFCLGFSAIMVEKSLRVPSGAGNVWVRDSRRFQPSNRSSNSFLPKIFVESGYDARARIDRDFPKLRRISKTLLHYRRTSTKRLCRGGTVLFIQVEIVVYWALYESSFETLWHRIAENLPLSQ